MMLNEDADEALERAEDRAVKHQRMVFLAILADVDRAEPLRHRRVELVRAALPGTADRVGQMELELGPIESALAGQHFIIEPSLLERGLEIGFGTIPLLIAPDPLVGPGRKLHLVIGKAEVAVDGVEQRAEPLGLLDQLIARAKDVPVVLRELAHAHDPVERTVRLVAVTAAELSEPERQLAVRGDALLEDLDVSRAVHRLQRHQLGIAGNDRLAFVGARHFVGNDEHVRTELAPVAREHPQL